MEKNVALKVKTSSGYDTVYPKTKAELVDGLRVSETIVESVVFFSHQNKVNDTDIDLTLTVADAVRTVSINQTTERIWVYCQIINNTGAVVTMEFSVPDGVTLRAVNSYFDLEAGGCKEYSYIRRGNVITFMETSENLAEQN